MRKTTLLIDDEILRQASLALATHGIKATIDKALSEAIAAHARRRALERFRTMKGIDLNNPDVMAQAWK